MRQFLTYTLILLAGTVAVMSVLDLVYTETYRHAKPRSKFQYLQSFRNQKIDYIFLGSSRVENGINPIIVEERTGKTCVNFGIAASKLSDIYTVLKLLDTYNIQFEKVFIQIDYIFNVNERSNIFQYQIIPFIRDDKTIRESLRHLDNFYACYYVPFYRYCTNEYRLGFRELSLSIAGKKGNVMPEYNGYLPRYWTATGPSNVILPTTIQTNNPDFDSIRSYCKRHQIKPVYFCAPFMKGVQNIDFTDKLAGKIPGFKNYAKLITNDSLFVDGRHLNDEGATFFTNFLVSDLGL